MILSAPAEEQATDVLALLCEYVRTKGDEDVLDYVLVQTETGYDMSPHSGLRRIFWRALNKMRGRGCWYKERNTGVRLSSPRNSLEFTERGMLGVSRKLDGVIRETKNRFDRHAHEMTEADRRATLSVVGSQASIRLALSTSLTRPRAEPEEKPVGPMLPKKP